MEYLYRESVLAELARHGVIPSNDTSPDLVHDFVSDLYRYEIRALKQRMVSGLIPKNQYAAYVEELRKRYPVLSLPKELWAAAR
ncbi:MAG: hypothetical protein DMF61_26185 [Blastocatellia bacterium AA13]|nr:MAG: hypothetical protein DMF61_26185 [Blastocatellia bacterium AA13]